MLAAAVGVNDVTAWGEVGIGVLRAAAADSPRCAGVYLFLDENADVLYVGKAIDLRQRLRQHAAAADPQWRLHQKYDLVRRVVWEPAGDENAAFWREAELIFALDPPFNANPDRRTADIAGTDVPVPYVVVVEDPPGTLRLTLEPTVPALGRAYGCFPHLGKGAATRIGVACSDGYTALLRLLWAAAGQGDHVPAGITRSAPTSFTVTVPAGVEDKLHRFLSGSRARLVDELLVAASHRPDFMQPALRRDKDAALEFFATGPQLVRARRLRHRVRARMLDAATYRDLVRAEIAPILHTIR